MCFKPGNVSLLSMKGALIMNRNFVLKHQIYFKDALIVRGGSFVETIWWHKYLPCHRILIKEVQIKTKLLLHVCEDLYPMVSDWLNPIWIVMTHLMKVDPWLPYPYHSQKCRYGTRWHYMLNIWAICVTFGYQKVLGRSVQWKHKIIIACFHMRLDYPPLQLYNFPHTFNLKYTLKTAN